MKSEQSFSLEAYLASLLREGPWGWPAWRRDLSRLLVEHGFEPGHLAELLKTGEGSALLANLVNKAAKSKDWAWHALKPYLVKAALRFALVRPPRLEGEDQAWGPNLGGNDKDVWGGGNAMAMKGKPMQIDEILAAAANLEAIRPRRPLDLPRHPFCLGGYGEEDSPLLFPVSLLGKGSPAGPQLGFLVARPGRRLLILAATSLRFRPHEADRPGFQAALRWLRDTQWRERGWAEEAWAEAEDLLAQGRRALAMFALQGRRVSSGLDSVWPGANRPEMEALLGFLAWTLVRADRRRQVPLSDWRGRPVTLAWREGSFFPGPQNWFPFCDLAEELDLAAFYLAEIIGWRPDLARRLAEEVGA